MNTVDPIRNRTKIEAIKDNLRDTNPRDYLLFVMGINLAFRASDLLALKVRDVVDEDGNIRHHVCANESKTRKRRTVYLNRGVREALAYYFNFHDKTDLSAPLFHSQKRPHQPIGRTQAYRLINKWCDQVGLTGNYGTHSLRKTFGYWARQMGVPISLIRDDFGHTTEEVTRRYVGISQQEIDDIHEKVDL